MVLIRVKLSAYNLLIIGSYVQLRGMVTKVSDVRPIINVACYFCEVCGFEVYHTVIL